MATPGPHNFIVRKGESFATVIAVTVEGTALDHTGYTVEMDVRENPASDTTLLTFTAGNGRAGVNGSGNITLSLSATDSAALTFDRGFYDLKVTSPGGTVSYYLEGQFIVKPTITR